jgi:hypothetical protein
VPPESAGQRAEPPRPLLRRQAPPNHSRSVARVA